MNNCANIFEENKTIFIVGPTASGKSDIAHRLAIKLNRAEIISADSMQVYKQIDVLTAKPSKEMLREIPYHLVGIKDIQENYSARDFHDDALRCITEIHSRKNIAIVVGGTGLYVRSLLRGIFEGPAAEKSFREEMNAIANEKGSEALHTMLMQCDPVAAGSIPHQNVRRVIRALEVFYTTGKKISELQIEWNRPVANIHPHLGRLYLWGIYWPRSLLYDRINRRVDDMIEQGAVDEVKRLITYGILNNPTASQALGIHALSDYIKETLSLQTAVNLLKQNTRRFAKRQLTWFGREDLFEWFVLYNESSKLRITDLMLNNIA